MNNLNKMSFFRIGLLMLTLLTGMVASTNALAEQKKTLGKWDVHYMAVSTTFLTPEVAKAYGVTRSKNSILVNISVLDRMSKKAQSVSITGNARNLLGRTSELSFTEVKEGEAIYYLATMPFDDEEHYRFDIRIQGSNSSQSLKFEQKLYKEG